MEQTECSKMLAYKIQMPGITQKKAHNIQNTENFEIKNNPWRPEHTTACHIGNLN